MTPRRRAPLHVVLLLATIRLAFLVGCAAGAVWFALWAVSGMIAFVTG